MILLFFISAGCKDDGVKITIRPKNTITRDCLLRAISSASKEIAFQDEFVNGKYTYLNFKMSEAFDQKVAELKIPGSENLKVLIASWLKKDREELKEIKFDFVFDGTQIPKMSEEDQAKLFKFIRPYALGVRALPDRLFAICSLQADPKNDVEVRCDPELCISQAPPSENVDCYDTDTVPLWENAFCQAETLSTDSSSAAFQECFAKYKLDRGAPTGRCQKIKWLKQKTCPLLKSNNIECLQKRDFLKRS